MKWLILFFPIVLLSGIIEPIDEVTNYDKAKVRLGKKLFFDPILSKDGSVSCVSCHSHFGADANPVSTGVDGKTGLVNAPTVFNATNNFWLFWNGRSHSLEEQMDFPIHAEHEMASNQSLIERRLNESKVYIEAFARVYGKRPGYELVKDAIVAFQKTLTTPNSRFDRYLKGEDTLSEKELQGYKMFKTYGCVSCHNGKNVGGNSIQKIGNVVEYDYTPTLDRYVLTNREEDKNMFRVPSLRNVAQTAPYFHDGRVATLYEAVRQMGYYNLGTVLTHEEIEAIVAFLKSLDGELPKSWSEGDE